MICPVCEGKGIVPADLHDHDANRNWDGSERRKQDRNIDNNVLRFAEIQPNARFTACPRCDGAGKLFTSMLTA